MLCPYVILMDYQSHRDTKGHLQQLLVVRPSTIESYNRGDLETLGCEGVDKDVFYTTTKRLQMESTMDEQHSLYNELWK